MRQVIVARSGWVRSQFRVALRFMSFAAVGSLFALSSGCGKNPRVTSSNQPPQLQSRIQPEAVSLAELERAAESGDAKGQLELADRYLAGQGTPRNLSKACNWFERAATSGEVKGMIGAAGVTPATMEFRGTQIAPSSGGKEPPRKEVQRASSNLVEPMSLWREMAYGSGRLEIRQKKRQMNSSFGKRAPLTRTTLQRCTTWE